MTSVKGGEKQVKVACVNNGMVSAVNHVWGLKPGWLILTSCTSNIYPMFSSALSTWGVTMYTNMFILLPHASHDFHAAW